MKNGGKSFILENDFKKPVDPENEKMSFDFLINHLESILAKFKPRDKYELVVDGL